MWVLSGITTSFISLVVIIAIVGTGLSKVLRLQVLKASISIAAAALYKGFAQSCVRKPVWLAVPELPAFTVFAFTFCHAALVSTLNVPSALEDNSQAFTVFS